MATIIKEIQLKASPQKVWAALRDVGNIHNRLARGFVTETRLEGNERIVCFMNGIVVRERIVTLDDERQRLAYSAVSERLAHHHASFQVFPDGEGTRLLWIADLLPDDMAETIGGMMEAGTAAMRATLDEEVLARLP
jgi:carbon monoxide dehydrogenase subunit G